MSAQPETDVVETRVENALIRELNKISIVAATKPDHWDATRPRELPQLKVKAMLGKELIPYYGVYAFRCEIELRTKPDKEDGMSAVWLAVRRLIEGTLPNYIAVSGSGVSAADGNYQKYDRIYGAQRWRKEGGSYEISWSEPNGGPIIQLFGGNSDSDVIYYSTSGDIASMDTPWDSPWNAFQMGYEPAPTLEPQSTPLNVNLTDDYIHIGAPAEEVTSNVAVAGDERVRTLRFMLRGYSKI